MRHSQQPAVEHRAALVDDEFHFHALRLEMTDDIRRARGGIAGFFVVSEAKIQVAVELPACRQMIFHGFEQGNHVRLHILRAPAVDISVVGERTRERIVIPAVLRCGNHIDVAEIAPAFQSGVGAFQAVDDAVSRYYRPFRLGVQEGIGLFQPVAVIEERLLVVGVFLHH